MRHAYGNANVKPYVNTYDDIYANSDSYGGGYGYSYSYAYSNGDIYGYANANSNSDVRAIYDYSDRGEYRARDHGHRQSWG